MKTLPCLLLALALAGCVDGADWGVSDDFTCKAMKPVSSYCGDCDPPVGEGENISDPGYDTDGDLNTARTVSWFWVDEPGEDGSTAIGAGLSGGPVYPAGEKPGVIYQFPTGGDVTMLAVISTRLNDVTQEQVVVIPEQTLPATGELMYIGFTSPTTLPFDALEFGLLERDPLGKGHVHKLYEFCLDGGAR